MTDLRGLVLAGGRSSRMGTDKGQLVFHQKPQREFLFELLGNYCANVFTSCRPGQALPPALNPLADRYAVSSPLNGLLSAFTLHEPSAWITVPIDMPNIQKSAIEFLLSTRDTSCLATCFCDSDGVLPDPLVAIWEKESISQLLKFYDTGGISPRQFLMQSNTRVVTPTDPRWLLNVNTLEEWEAWKHNHRTA